MAAPSRPPSTSPARRSPFNTSAPNGGGAPSKAIGSMRLRIAPRRFMREVVSCPTKQPLWKSMPFSRSKFASMG